MAISVDTFLGPLLPDGLRRCRDLLLYLIARTGAMAVVRFGPLLSRWSGDKPHIFRKNGYRGRLGPFLLRSAPIGPCPAFTSRHPSSMDQASPKPINAAKIGLERLHFIIFEDKGSKFVIYSRASISLTSPTRSFKDSSARSALKLVRAGSPFLLRPNPTAKRSSRI